MKIEISENGPYEVSGGVPLVRAEIVIDDAGESVAWHETERLDAGESYSLCRCGASSTKPFCDYTHAAIGFDGAESAGHGSFMEEAACIDGPSGIKLHDVRRLCAEARFCDRAGGLWNLVEAADDPATLGLVRSEAAMCPSGRYVVCHDADDAADVPEEPELEPSIVLVEDPAFEVSGPLWVRGGIPIVGADGEPYEVRNRVTLCRCGESKNKPFCDGSHIGAGFRDDR